MTTNQNEVIEINPQKEHRRLYWFWKHIEGQLGAFIKCHAFLFIMLLITGLVTLFLFRAVAHPLVIAIRTRIFLLVIGVPLLLLLKKLIFFGRWWRRLVVAALATFFFWTMWEWGDEIHEYFALYYQYQKIRKVELEKLPTTDFERIQPLHSVYSLAYEAMARSEVRPMMPNFVRIGIGFEWTVGIEPDHLGLRLTQGVQKVLHASATTPNVNFLDPQSHVRVSFPVGENLLWGKNVFRAAVKTFGLWRYLNYEPKRVLYLTNDQREWVQVVCLIRWRGLFFPRPEFGGIQIIRQRQETLLTTASLFLFGIGEWIPPNEVMHHSFLRGQHLVPYEVSRYIANSFRFREGFKGPLPWIHQGDVRIPDLEHDINLQPFTTYFYLPGKSGMLYHYFGLEPYGREKQATTVSLFIPADNPTVVYLYPHDKRGHLVTGVSTIPAKVIGSQKMYTWSENWPVEHRPFIREIDGDVRFCWLTTVITKKGDGEGKKQFIAGAIPDLIITDGICNVPVWVNPLAPNTWVNEIRKHIQASCISSR